MKSYGCTGSCPDGDGVRGDQLVVNATRRWLKPIETETRPRRAL